MKKMIGILLTVMFLTTILNAETLLRKYGTSTTVDFELYDSNNLFALLTNAVSVDGDCKIMKDEGAEATVDANFVDEGQGYSITLSATEMTASRIVLYIVDQTSPRLWADKYITILTYGNDSAQYPFIDANSNIRSELMHISLGANVLLSSDVTAAVPTAAQNATATKAAIDPNLEYIDTLVGRVTSTRAGYWDNLSGGAVALASEVNELPEDIWSIAARTITGGTITTYTGNTPQTGDNYTRIGAPVGASISVDIAAITSGGTTYARNTTVAAASSTTQFTITAGKTTNDAYLNQIISVKDLDDDNIEVRYISGYVGSTRTVTVNVPFSFTPATKDVVHILETSYNRNPYTEWPYGF